MSRIEPVVEVDGIPHHRLDMGPQYPTARDTFATLSDQAWLTAGVAGSVCPSVIHASSGVRGYELALVALALRDHIRRPVVYEVLSFFESGWSHDPRVNQTGELFERRLATKTRAMLAADHVLTISEAMRAEVIGRGVPATQVSVLPDGVDADALKPGPPDPAIRERHGVKDAFLFGYVGNLDHRSENPELLVAATAVLRGRGRNVACCIVGDGSRRAEIEQAARDAGVADKVTCTGRVPQEEVSRYYATLDAFVVPRGAERATSSVSPLMPYEALAMEVPLVVPDLPALLEIAEPELRGLAFRADDASHLADQLERLIDDPALRGRLGTAGRRWVVAERSWAANGARLREVYREVETRWAAREGVST